MIYYLFTLILITSNVISFAQTEFVKPWANQECPIVVDVYKDNIYDIKKLTQDKRIKGIIHKMSEEDSTQYYKRRAEATSHNLLYGSYWLPKYDSNGTAQADKYLKMVGDSNVSKEFLALDFEMHKKTKQFISVHNAYLFVKRIYEKTGRYPYIYCGLSNLEKLEASEYKETFKKCKLWIIALTTDGNITSVFKDKKVWTTYSMWQFSCEINCCKSNPVRPCFYKISGIECGIDYDVYNGDFKKLLKEWAN